MQLRILPLNHIRLPSAPKGLSSCLKLFYHLSTWKDCIAHFSWKRIKGAARCSQSEPIGARAHVAVERKSSSKTRVRTANSLRLIHYFITAVESARAHPLPSVPDRSAEWSRISRLIRSCCRWSCFSNSLTLDLWALNEIVSWPRPLGWFVNELWFWCPKYSYLTPSPRLKRKKEKAKPRQGAKREPTKPTARLEASQAHLYKRIIKDDSRGVDEP